MSLFVFCCFESFDLCMFLMFMSLCYIMDNMNTFFEDEVCEIASRFETDVHGWSALRLSTVRDRNHGYARDRIVSFTVVDADDVEHRFTKVGGVTVEEVSIILL